MEAKKKLKKEGRPGGKPVCCTLLKEKKPEIESYLQGLIEAETDSSRMKWAWGIITAARQITDTKDAPKGKSYLCSKCESYLEPRRRLAELVIQGCESN